MVARTVMMMVGLMAVAIPAGASTLTPDFGPLRSDAALARGGDFDGDGRHDDLFFSDERQDGRIAVHVRLNTVGGARDLRVTSLDVPAGAEPDVRVVPAGRFTADCGSYATACAPLVTQGDSLILGMGSGTSVLVHWNGTGFDSDFVRDDQADMARALSALYALNP